MKKAACSTATSAADFLPAGLELPVLAKASQKCKGCGIYCNATQAVFGEGPADATCMFVGEQPGDQSLLGSAFRLTHHRGQPQTSTPWSPWLLATVHPSSLLRIPDAAAREQARAQFADDLRLAARQLKTATR